MDFVTAAGGSTRGRGVCKTPLCLSRRKVRTALSAGPALAQRNCPAAWRKSWNCLARPRISIRPPADRRKHWRVGLPWVPHFLGQPDLPPTGMGLPPAQNSRLAAVGPRKEHGRLPPAKPGDPRPLDLPRHCGSLRDGVEPGGPRPAVQRIGGHAPQAHLTRGA